METVFNPSSCPASTPATTTKTIRTTRNLLPNPGPNVVKAKLTIIATATGPETTHCWTKICAEEIPLWPLNEVWTDKEPIDTLFFLHSGAVLLNEENSTVTTFGWSALPSEMNLVPGRRLAGLVPSCCEEADSILRCFPALGYLPHKALSSLRSRHCRQSFFPCLLR